MRPNGCSTSDGCVRIGDRPDAGGGGGAVLTGGGTGSLNITGAIYFPNNPVSYSGGGGVGGVAQCTQLIAYTITFSGNATLNNNCTGSGVQQINYTNGTLVL